MHFLALAASLSALLAPQDDYLAEANAAGREITDRVRDAEAGGNLLTVMEALRGLEAEYASKGDIAREMLGVYSMQRAAELGNVADALRYADRSETPSTAGASEAAVARVAGLEAVNALDGIEALAEDELVVMINEAHHVPQHRAFTLELLPRLRALGFTHFAAETIAESDAGIQARGYATKASGAYMQEPVYADLVRAAIAEGFVIVPYEATHTNPDRELGQATNLIERVLDVADDARLVVHAGYAHINETGAIANARAMAGQFRELTGIDPLTIDQTAMTEHSEPRFEHPLYTHVVDGRELTEPVLLTDDSGAPWSLSPGVRDVTLFHPRSVFEHGRPTWMRMGGRREPFELPADVCGDAPRCVVEARASNEGEDAIPVDRVEVRAGEPVPALMLPAGAFVIEAKSASNERLWGTTATIE